MKLEALYQESLFTVFLCSQMFEQYIAPSMKTSDIVVPWGESLNFNTEKN